MDLHALDLVAVTAREIRADLPNILEDGDHEVLLVEELGRMVHRHDEVVGL